MSDSSVPPEIDQPNPRPDASDGASVQPPADSEVLVTRQGVTVRVNLAPVRPSPFSRIYGNGSFAEAWSKFWEVDPPACPVLLREGATWPKSRRSTPAHLTSLLFHISVVYFCYSVPFGALLRRFLPPQEVKNTHMNVVAIEFHGLSLPPRLPDLRPPDLGGAPGQGEKPEAKPKLGVTHFDPRVSIISNPAHPDNLRFTVHNPAVPPHLKLPKDLRVPNLILGSLTPLPQPPPAPPKLPKPAPPAPKAEPPTPSLKPKLVLPPDLVPLTELDLASKLPPIPVPHLEVQAGPSPPPAKNATPPGPEVPVSAAPTPETDTANAASPDGEKHPGTAQLTTLSIDPIPLKDMTSIPAGNAEGAFAIGPAAGGPGSPGGVPGGELGAGKGGPGLGGDKSVAVGKGGAGGGGAPGSAGAGGSLSVTNLMGGPGGAVGGTLPPLDVQSLVFPVNPADLKARATGIVVSSGAGGGGGLRIYGVLHGGKVYTIYLAMPGKSWVLQFCAHDDTPKPAPTSRVVDVHMQPPLTPPDAVGQFDFHRPALTTDPAYTMVVLHGIIHEDGTVSNLEVVQSVESTFNEAAMAAFARWKFRPALQSGKPVAVEILVGIPALVPGR